MHPSSFSLEGRVALITGGAGLLGGHHARAIHAVGGIPILADIDLDAARTKATLIGPRAVAARLDVTDESSIAECLALVVREHGQCNILINNAACNPAVENRGKRSAFVGIEHQTREAWDFDLAVGLTGTMLCCKVVGAHFAASGGGVIVNIGSEYSFVAPDQRVYRQAGRTEIEQPKKPVSYTVVKHAIIGLTRHLATYWADQNVRVNALCPGGIANGQPEEFSARMRTMIPMGRMACGEEMEGAVVFLCSDASRFMTGTTVVVDGGRTIW